MVIIYKDLIMLPKDLKKNDVISITFKNGKSYKGKIRKLMHNWIYVMVHSKHVGNSFYYLNKQWYYRPSKHKKLPDYPVNIGII